MPSVRTYQCALIADVADALAPWRLGSWHSNSSVVQQDAIAQVGIAIHQATRI
jgi:hypothetical protein